jgi:hypothetical protein
VDRDYLKCDIEIVGVSKLQLLPIEIGSKWSALLKVALLKHGIGPDGGASHGDVVGPVDEKFWL